MGRYCEYTVNDVGDLFGAQSNDFLEHQGPMQALFEEEYVRFFTAMLDMPQYQPCAVVDAAVVLMTRGSGVIRAAFVSALGVVHLINPPPQDSKY